MKTKLDSDTRAPQAVLFDAYGTLFDVYSVAQLAEELFPGQSQALSELGMVTRRCGSTVTISPLKNWAPRPRAPATACVMCSTSFLPDF